MVLLRLWGVTEAVVDAMHRIMADPNAKDRDQIAVAKLVLDLILPVGYEPRSRYAFSDDEIAATSAAMSEPVESDDVDEVETFDELPDVVA